MRDLRSCLRKTLSLYLILALLALGCLPADLMAAMIPSDLDSAGVAVGIERAADIQKIQAMLESKLVVQRLTDLGLSVEEVQLSMAKLTSQELHDVASNLDGLQTGGELGLIITLLVVAVLVLLVVFLVKRV